MEDVGTTLAAPTIFFFVTLLQFVPRYFEHQIKGSIFLRLISSELLRNEHLMNSDNASVRPVSEEEKRLRNEIKELLKEADTLSQPSTFAQAAKLRRTAAAKEKELAKYQEQQILERKLSYGPYMKYATPVKALAYLLLAFWFWKSPVATISKELVQPFGKILSWKSGSGSVDKVMVGIIPWLILCTRVSKLICRKFIT